MNPEYLIKKQYSIALAALAFIAIVFFIYLKPPSKKVEVKNTFDVIEGKNTYLPYQFSNLTASKLNDEAEYYFSEKEFSIAISKLKAAVAIEPDNPKLYFNLASCYSFTDSFKLELESLSQAMQLDPSFYGFYIFRGIAFYKHHDLSNAIKDFKTAASMDSSNWVVYTNMARTYYDQGEVDSACTCLTKAKNLGFTLEDSDMPVVFRQLEDKCAP